MYDVQYNKNIRQKRLLYANQANIKSRRRFN